MKPSFLLRPFRTRPSLLTLLALGALSLVGIAFVASAATGGCRHVRGRLVDGSRFIGGISGDYSISEIVYDGDCPFEPFGDVNCTVAFSTVAGNRGSIDFVEYGTLDFAEQQGTNGAVLLIPTGGTGKWEGASGHLVLSGYFHLEGWESNWDYQGEICTP